MDPEIKNLLEENLKLSKENNELLLKVRRVQKWAQYSRIFYWVIILGITYGAFYYLQPYLDSLLNVYTGGVGNISDINNVGDIKKNIDVNQMKDLIKSLNQ